MSRHVVIGTAGHVDHGKTTLVRALTGVDTDRWEEEKRRGITIDIGFAPLPLPGGIAASVVDVPGHEDFVRNMVAGATGVDVALLVVAADEGVMPQTVEHLAILEFLGVRTGVVAITKADLVDAEWLELVTADVTERLAASPLAWEEPVVVSATAGNGLDALLERLSAAAEHAAQRSADDLFRLPVDRVFSVAGAGTVVTGTAWSGSVATGEEVRILPGDTRGRVRSVEVHGERRERATPGRRTALALAGVDRGAVIRGSVVVTDPSWRECRAVDAVVTLLPHARPLTQRSRVRLHLGTAEVLTRVTPARPEIPPGGAGAARLRLEAPLVARWGDRGVLRSYSPVTTIGGVVVADPWPAPRPRRPAALADCAAPDPAARVLAFVRKSGRRGVAQRDLPVRGGIHPGELARVLGAATQRGAVRVGERLVTADILGQLRSATLGALAGYHKSRPQDAGMPLELVRVASGGTDLADHILTELAAVGKVAVGGGVARLVEHRPALAGAQADAADAVRARLANAGWHGVTPQEAGDGVGPEVALEVLEYFVRQGTAVRVGRGRYYEKGALDRLRDTVLEEVRRLGRASPAQLRDRTGLTRKYLIPVLEWLDACGLTVRDGDARRLP